MVLSNKSKLPNSCIHAKVVMHIVAKEQGALKKGVWSTEPYVKGADGRVRATKAAQVLTLVPIPTSEHYFKESTMDARAKKRKEREEEKNERARAADAKRQAREEHAAERRRAIEAADACKAGVEARNEKGKWCSCDGSADGDMVSCSRCMDWFHFSCVSYEPTNKQKRWYCDICERAIEANKSRKSSE